METSKLKKFAQQARRTLMELVSSKLNLVLDPESAARREHGRAVADLETEIKSHSRDQVVEKVAYIWFNRFCALRYMDVKRFTPVGTLSPASGQTQPEILAEAKMGVMDEAMIPADVQKQVTTLLSGEVPSSNPQNEAYRLLVVAACNYYSKVMPFLFQPIAHYTELLMPDDLLSANSILADTRKALTDDACKDVEVIGWLYQFYISEKKDAVFEGLKKNKKITPENIPAATQLFTPHWIVRYLVENSLGRLWMLNRPDSRLIDQMEYYIRPEQAETDFVRIESPEEIKICDIACGSGHMMTYAFDLLYAIYEEEGYDASKIPGLILENNLFGIEIDERAGELAAFALFMKAREKYRRFFRKAVQPHICVLQNIEFPEGDLAAYMDAIGRDLFTANLQTLLHQFREADNFGSLIRPVVTNVKDMQQILKSRGVGDNMFLANTHEKVLKALEQAEYLSPRYHVLVTNPPYMGGKSMNGRLKVFAQDNYSESKADLFAMFIERNLGMAKKSGLVAMITMQSWMFLSSFERLREIILAKDTVLSMAHLGERAFDTIGGAVVSTTAFVIGNFKQPNFVGGYFRLIGGKNETEKNEMLRNKISVGKMKEGDVFYKAPATNFERIPGSPIAYWVSGPTLQSFIKNPKCGDFERGKFGMSAADPTKIQCWFEVSNRRIKFDATESSEFSDLRPFAPYDKGGGYRKWYGNRIHVINWANDGQEIRENPRSAVRNASFFCKEHISWTLVNSGSFSCRFFETGFLLDTASNAIYRNRNIHLRHIAAILNSKYMAHISTIVNPTLNFSCGVIDNVPVAVLSNTDETQTNDNVGHCISMARGDWNDYETAWSFVSLPLLNIKQQQMSLSATYTSLRNQWRETTLEMRCLEEENNRILIEAYGLQDELTPDVPLEEITLTCNPYYRYAAGKTDEEYKKLLLADTMREFISYAVGCMFGRYSLDKPGLILANQGESVEDYLRQVPEPTFEPDEDNVIPILDQDWFMDDMAGRFYRFLKVTFGEEHYDENLAFVEDAIGKDIRKFFLKDFYTDHLKRYKKRPIYWLFSSPKGSFNALIYMHRYRSDTVSIVLNEYLREFRGKLKAHGEHLERVSINPSSTSAEKTRAVKEIEKLKKTIDELDQYERDTLYPLAAQKVEIDLDDGVKVNYKKFGDALKKVPGLSG